LAWVEVGHIYCNHIVRRADEACLSAVVSSRPEVAAKVAGESSKAKAYTDYRDLLADPAIDGVIVAVHTHTHHDIVIAAAEAGKAIFCEKPIALTLAETDTMLKAVEKAGVLFQAGFMRRFDKGYVAAKRKIEAGEIGTPIMAHSISRDPNCPEPDWANPVASGGLILDLAIHDFDILRWLMNDEVERVYTEGGLFNCPELAQVSDIDNAIVSLRFARGGLGNAEACRNVQYGYDIRCEIRGTEGALQVGYLRDTPLLALTRQGVYHDVVPWFEERFSPAYGTQIDHFVQCIQRDEYPIVGFVDARVALKISLAATQSWQESRPINVVDVQDIKYG